jgi:hypothetical protein
LESRARLQAHTSLDKTSLDKKTPDEFYFATLPAIKQAA